MMLAIEEIPGKNEEKRLLMAGVYDIFLIKL